MNIPYHALVAAMAEAHSQVLHPEHSEFAKGLPQSQVVDLQSGALGMIATIAVNLSADDVVDPAQLLRDIGWPEEAVEVVIAQAAETQKERAS